MYDVPEGDIYEKIYFGDRVTLMLPCVVEVIWSISIDLRRNNEFAWLWHCLCAKQFLCHPTPLKFEFELS